MRRAYRFFLTVYIEGETAADLPTLSEVAEDVATEVQDENDHDLEICLRPIETEDYQDEQEDTQAPPHFIEKRRMAKL